MGKPAFASGAAIEHGMHWEVKQNLAPASILRCT